IILVLIQLPKKEAGAGLAFGGGATDALFGAGSGTVLTKVTKYAAGTFFVLAILLSTLQSHWARRPSSDFRQRLQQTSSGAPAVLPPASGTTAASTGTTNSGLLSTPPESPVVPAATNQSPAAATNQ